jgi:hypothetical protein
MTEPTVPPDDDVTRDTTAPDEPCAVAGCQLPAVVSVPSVLAGMLVPGPDAEIVPLCADHAEMADDPERPTQP